MALPSVFVGVVFLIAVGGALSAIVYLAWKGSKPSDFFTETVTEYYELELTEADIDSYYDLKEKLQGQYAPDYEQELAQAQEEQKPVERWTTKVPTEDRGNLQKALMRRLVTCIGKLDQVQRDKPGNWKLWQSKLISERYWSSLLDAEKMVSTEIDSCIAEADELENGWRERVFHQGVQLYRMQKQQEADKKMAKKEVVDQKKAVEKEEKRKENEKRQEVEAKVKQAKDAEKAMEKLLREEEQASKSKGKAKAASAAPKSKSKKK